MSLLGYFIIFLAFALIIGGIITIKQSAKKFILSDEQTEKIKKRQQEQLDKDRQNK